MKSATVLVTGVAGFIGSHVAAHLAAAGHKVVGLDDLSGGFEDNIPKPVTFVKGSILDAALIEELFREHRFDTIFHLAAYAAEGLSHFVRSFNYTNNVVGSMNLISCAVHYRVRRFVFTSSIAVYGAGQLPMKEDHIPQPEDPYGIAKFAVEQDLRAAHRMFGLNYVIFRPHNVYGEGQNIGDPFRNVVGIFMRQLLAHQPLTVFGDGKQTRAFSHIDDVAPIITRAPWMPEATNQVFNVGAEEPFTVIELAHLIGRAIGVEPRIEHLPARMEVQNAHSDHSKARRVFGEHSPVPLVDGLRRMADWVRKAGVRQTPWFPTVEIEEGLPEVWRSMAQGGDREGRTR